MSVIRLISRLLLHHWSPQPATPSPEENDHILQPGCYSPAIGSPVYLPARFSDHKSNLPPLKLR